MDVTTQVVYIFAVMLRFEWDAAEAATSTSGCSPRRPRKSLSVDFAPMPDPQHEDEHPRVFDFRDDSMVPHAIFPKLAQF